MATDGMDVSIDSLRFDGSQAAADVIGALTKCDLERTIDGAPTLTIQVEDTNQFTLLRSGLFDNKITTQFDTLSFEIVGVKKSGLVLTAVFEDIIVSSLRTHKEPRKAAAGTTTRVDFIRLLCQEEPWIQVYVPPGVEIEPAKKELARGEPDTQPTAQQLAKDPDAGKESTWDCANRLMDDIGWRCFTDGRRLILAPETWLIQQLPMAVLSEDTEGVDDISFDWDEGKPIATASIQMRANRWDFPPGSVISLTGCGPANGPWIVSKISRSAFSQTASIDLSKARPVIPEPDDSQVVEPGADAVADASEGAPDPGSSGEGKTTIPTVVAPSGYLWPARGWIISGFGMRNGHLHEGIDIVLPENSPVVAARDGTVVFADSLVSYGKVVYIDHGDGITRYALLNSINTKKGVQVHQGQLIGKSGGKKGATNEIERSAGTHLHFEIRPGNQPEDPMKFLSDTARVPTSELLRLGRAN